MSRFLRYFLPSCILTVLIGCGSEQGKPTNQQSYTPRLQRVEVKFAEVKRELFSTRLELTGNLLPRRITRVMAEVDGIVESIPATGPKFEVEANGRQYSEQLGITLGQPVRKGEILLQLKPRDFEVALRLAQAKLSKAEADLAKLRSWQRPEEIERLTALRNEAKARFNQATRTYERLNRLVKRNAVSQSDFEQATLEMASTQAMLESAQANLKAAKAGPTPEEVAVQKALILQAKAEVEQKQQDLDKTTIRAPFDAVVTAFNVEVGDRVLGANGPLIDLLDVRYLIAEVGIPESYIGSIHVQDRAEVHLSGTTQPVPGLVIALNELVEPGTRTFRARIAIDNEERRFKAGQFARVSLRMKATENTTLTVPSKAIVLVEGEPHVFLLKEGKAHQASVKTGLTNASSTEILHGLKAGDRVITDDPSLLTSGMKVTTHRSGNSGAAN